MAFPRLSVKELKQRIDAGEDVFILDVREPFEYQIAKIGGKLIPQNDVPHRLAEIDRDREIVVQCKSGGRSQRIAEFLAQSGYSEVVEPRRRHSGLGRPDRPHDAKVLSGAARPRKRLRPNGLARYERCEPRISRTTGRYVRLEPLGLGHRGGLVAASAADPSLYQWSPVPKAKRPRPATSKPHSNGAMPEPLCHLLRSHRGWRNPRLDALFDIERWAWPKGHPRQGRRNPDVCEIGYTWLTRSAIRTAANTETNF